MEAFPFRYRQRVRFGETDLQNVVYYANCLAYAEVGTGEAGVRYTASLRFDDEFDINVRVGEIRFRPTRIPAALRATLEQAKEVEGARPAP